MWRRRLPNGSPPEGLAISTTSPHPCGVKPVFPKSPWHRPVHYRHNDLSTLFPGPEISTAARVSGNAEGVGSLPLNTIWLSDTHLGYKGCKAAFLLDFLESTRCEVLYLVGDIVDFWAMKRSFVWPDSHQRVLSAILDKARNGTRVVYIPGNHDALSHHIAGHRLLDVEICSEFIHTTAQGKRLLLVHGDQFDHAVRCSRLDRWVGDWSYDFLLWLNRLSNGLRRCLKLPYWSLAYYVKNRVKNARQAIDSFEQAAAQECHARGVDGIVCGHIHQPEMRYINGKLYCNDGDWVESCTALVEHAHGELELVHWGDLRQPLRRELATDNDVDGVDQAYELINLPRLR
ncbi:MAG TPA: UDP-2,3-diacylglucosamine hydrolase [Porticoccaceae bacterium]|nr:UDP-2,3-diacylglucosamine hydrolase [Porticoccaceae bacterium]HCO59768.1 UDP-2,3-diacylglucosamine hydrolase [Porticoccaceae bacterium]